MPDFIMPMRLATLLALSLLGFAPAAQAARPAAAQIALTFDDLPAISLVEREAYIEDLNRRLLAGLKRHRIPATGFVNEGKLDEFDRARQTAILKAWLDAGMDLGNHTFSHETPSELGVKAYIDDIAAGDKVTKALLAARGRHESWFRPPYLETGQNPAAKQEIQNWLTAAGYTIAPVTLNANDWQFAEPYDDAIAHRAHRRAAQIRRAYLAYTRQMLEWYSQASHALFGRDIAYVMLLHDTRLNADCIDGLAALFKARRLKPVTLDVAMRDPAYLTPDRYTKGDGVDWMERFSQSLGKALPWGRFHDVPKAIQRAYDRVDPDRGPAPAPEQNAAQQ
jgi:peptidoglycan/xylan/chitin deacetylase (PgdA/CDA1 family)